MQTRKGKLFDHPFHLFIQASKLLLFALVVTVGIYNFNRLDFSEAFPIKTVRVYGINRLDQQEIKTLLLPLVKRGFFTVNVEYIRDRLLQLPWVAEIFVKRQWPDKVEINIVEKSAIANWNNMSLLSGGGELFTPAPQSYPIGLPKLVGPEGKQIIVMQYLKGINNLLIPLHTKVSTLTLSPYSTWHMKLDNGMMLQMGHKDVLTRLNQFVKVYPKIVGDRSTEVEYVDLRYPNGVAVKWKAAKNSESDKGTAAA